MSKQNREVLIVRNNKVSSLFDVALVDFEAETMQYLQQFLSFEQAAEHQSEYCHLYGIKITHEETSEETQDF